MSRLSAKSMAVLTPAPGSLLRSADPFERLRELQVPMRVLLDHGVLALRWVAEHPDLQLYIVERVGDRFVDRAVTPDELLRYAHEHGWEPFNQDDDCGKPHPGLPPAFEEIRWMTTAGLEGGPQWYGAADCWDDDVDLPLSFSQERRDEARAAIERDRAEYLAGLHQRAADAIAEKTRNWASCAEDWASGLVKALAFSPADASRFADLMVFTDRYPGYHEPISLEIDAEIKREIGQTGRDLKVAVMAHVIKRAIPEAATA